MNKVESAKFKEGLIKIIASKPEGITLKELLSLTKINGYSQKDILLNHIKDLIDQKKISKTSELYTNGWGGNTLRNKYFVIGER